MSRKTSRNPQKPCKSALFFYPLKSIKWLVPTNLFNIDNGENPAKKCPFAGVLVILAGRFCLSFTSVCARARARPKSAYFQGFCSRLDVLQAEPISRFRKVPISRGFVTNPVQCKPIRAGIGLETTNCLQMGTIRDANLVGARPGAMRAQIRAYVRVRARPGRAGP